ncbi:MAG: peptidase M61, partial [Bacteroidota bacterium]
MKTFICLIAWALPLAVLGTQDSLYHFSVDLRNAKHDTLFVELVTPTIKEEKVAFRFPKIVPGTYSVYNFGRFVSQFKAFDKEGKQLKVSHKTDDEWIIFNAQDLHKITYVVEDTYDTKKSNFVFEPGGTNIEAKENFIINPHGFFGYFKDMEFMPFEVTVHRPENFYGATALTPTKRTETSDTYVVENYHLLVDSPMMYNVPDTVTIEVGGAEILISVFTQGKKKLSAKEIANDISKTLNAQKAYMGGELPIKKYAFLIYLYKGMSGSGYSGALEHSYSSLYSLPSFLSEESLLETIIDVAAHEFFHILTPLSVHSEEIHYFDFHEPKMSKHLWLYEGTVEYFAQHVQLYEGIIELPEFLQRMRGKIINAEEEYNDKLPFTELSLGALDEHEDQYGNVYEKGALISLCLDVKLRELSGGKTSMMTLIQMLSDEYGKNKPFKDEKLFDKITELTYPEIGEFLKKHVEGSDPLPLEEAFSKIGVLYSPKKREKSLSIG